MPTHRRTLLAHILLLAVVLVWGTTFPLVKASLADISPLLFNLLRMSLAAVVLLALNPRTLRSLTGTELKFGATAGLFLALGYQLQTSGLAYTTPSKSAFLTGLVVVFVPILSLVPRVAPRGHPTPGPAVLFGALLAFIGLILLTSRPPGSPASLLAGVTGTGLALLSGLHLGEWLTLACAVAFAAHLLTLARAAPVVSARTLGTLQIAFAALVMLFTLPLGGHATLHLTSLVLITLFITAILATAAAFTIQSWAQQVLPPTHTALILTLEPVFAALTSLLFLHERFGPRELLGAALILAGILLAELLPQRPHSRRPQPSAIPPA